MEIEPVLVGARGRGLAEREARSYSWRGRGGCRGRAGAGPSIVPLLLLSHAWNCYKPFQCSPDLRLGKQRERLKSIQKWTLDCLSRLGRLLFWSGGESIKTPSVRISNECLTTLGCLWSCEVSNHQAARGEADGRRHTDQNCNTAFPLIHKTFKEWF